MIISVFLTGCGLFLLAFFVYGRFLDRRLGVSAQHPTPSHRLEDGVDFVPTRDMTLFGHHFSSIAGAGPIVGPVIAAALFGWLPAVLWIVIGAIFVGGVHDYTSLVASLRHDGRSIGDICRKILNPWTQKLFLVFILLTLIYVIIVFLDLTAESFAPRLPANTAPETAAARIHEGGIVATASLLFIGLAVGFGVLTRRGILSFGTATILFVSLVFLGIFAASHAPLTADLIPAFLGEARNTWLVTLLLYCMLASILPVWILLQPRDYLSSFLLYACLIFGALGLLIHGVTGSAMASYPAFIGWHHEQAGWIFPALFITIACGAVSGFHSIVASGTTAKQLDRESSARRIGYGAMLVEGVLALLAVATVMILKDKPVGNPVATFSSGLGVFLSTLGIPDTLAVAFGRLAVSTFLLTTLDTCTRLSRYVLQELLGWSNALHLRILGTLLVLVLPVLVVFREIPGANGVLMPAWQAIWPAFGATNQLLAALALLVVFAWLRRDGKPAWFVGIPMLFMSATTLTALFQLAVGHLLHHGSLFVGGVSFGLGLLALLVMSNTAMTLLRPGAAK